MPRVSRLVSHATLVGLTASVVFAVACQRASSQGPSRTATDAASPLAPASAASVAPPKGDASDVAEGPKWLPPFDFGPRGPIAVRGYPEPLNVSMSDAAGFYGWTAAGTFAYCAFDVCCAENQSFCSELDASGKATGVRTFDDKGNPVAGALKRMRAFVKDEHLTELKPGKEFEVVPAPLVGEWDFARDLTLHVAEVGQSVTKSGRQSAAVLRIGGAYANETPVWVWTSPLDKLCREVPDACMGASANGLALSPDGTELGIVVYGRYPSHGSSHEAFRLSVRDLAARIYNAVALRHHEKKEHAVAANLFVAAVRANPKEELYLYNLACAWSRAGDVRALDALKAAIGIGGEKVATRAKKDADFEALRTSSAFTALVGR